MKSNSLELSNTVSEGREVVVDDGRVSAVKPLNPEKLIDQTTAKERTFLKHFWGDRLRKPLRGKVINGLYVVEECEGRGKGGLIYLLVECIRCGQNKRFRVRADSVYSGRTKSCGCLRRDTLKLPPDQRLRKWTGSLDKLCAARTRFLERVKPGGYSTVCHSSFGPCLEWTGQKSKDGYAQLGVDVKKVQASHLAWFYEYGVMPKRPIRHVCDNPGCVNVKHLYEGEHWVDCYDKYVKSIGGILVEVPQGPYEDATPAPSTVSEKAAAGGCYVS